MRKDSDDEQRDARRSDAPNEQKERRAEESRGSSARRSLGDEIEAQSTRMRRRTAEHSVPFPSLSSAVGDAHDRQETVSTSLAVPEAPDMAASTASLGSRYSCRTDKSTLAEAVSSEQSDGAQRRLVTAGQTRLSELKRFTLYETRTRFYLVAYNTSQTAFRILKIDRIPDTRSEEEGSTKAPSENSAKLSQATKDAPAYIPSSQASTGAAATSSASLQWKLCVTADRVDYTRTQKTELLDMIGEGNRATGGLREVGKYFGIVGFIRFTSTYYMVLISRRSVVALLGGHYIYHCDETQIIPVCPPSFLATLGGRTKTLDQEESRLLHIFRQVDLGKNFYFSYTYDLTKTLQDNLTCVTPDDLRIDDSTTAWGYSEKFVWNHHLLLPAFAASEHAGGDDPTQEWVLPLVYGFVDQAKLRVLNWTIHVILIARRSRHFAGARFLKRGADEKGHVANDVETEQIVCDALTTSFYAPKARCNINKNAKYDPTTNEDMTSSRFGPNPRYTSYVMHRGSIPIFWTQDSTNMSPRPPIEISVVDPYYSAAALHFDDMFRRYGGPIVILNLIKSKEKQPREMKLLEAFGECVTYLNQFLPADKKLRYIAWDMSRASKSRDQDVIGVLEDIAEETIAATKFFHSGPEPTKFQYAPEKSDTASHGKYRETVLIQSGVARVNCVDCLDRTNAAQFVIGKAAFGHQLYALGLLDHPKVPYDSDATDMLTEMYHDLGDTIALQYGGSHLVNTMETYRKINHWSSHSRDMLEGLKRYYANSFGDAEKQMAINLFLGVDNEAPEFRPVALDARRSYQRWFSPEHLDSRVDIANFEAHMLQVIKTSSDFWQEYYRPSLFTDINRHHAFKMTAVHQQVALLHVQSQGPSSDRERSVSISASPQGSVISSPPTKYSRSRLASLSGNTYSVRSETTISPFTSRVPQSPIKDTGLRQAGKEESPSLPPLKQRDAIIGGVRRWISLNRGEDGSASPTSLAESTGVRTYRGKETADVESHGKSRQSSTSAAQSSKSAWPTWEEVTGANAALPSTGELLGKHLAPSVSEDEAKEYSSWLTQFRDVAFESGPEHAVPEPAALLSASHAHQTTHFPAGAGTLLGSEATSELAKGIPLLGGGSSLLQAKHRGGRFSGPSGMMGMRRPATQKQRQQVAEADALLYASEVAVVSGRMAEMIAAQSTMTDHSNTPATVSLGKGAPASHGSSGQPVILAPTSIEQAILNYPLSSGALFAQASETKSRAYTHWLAGHPQEYRLATAEPVGASRV